MLHLKILLLTTLLSIESNAMSSTIFSYEPTKYTLAHEEQRKSLGDRPLPTFPAPFESIKRGTKLKVAAVQLETPACSPQDFQDRAEEAVVKAVYEHGANLVLLQELFQGPYFCQSQEASLFALAENDVDGNNALITRMQDLAKRLQVVLPISLFERKNNVYYNSVVMIDADGTNLGTYRKVSLTRSIGALVHVFLPTINFVSRLHIVIFTDSYS
jgi:hypothetical protein